jgi:hypothetical protein
LSSSSSSSDDEYSGLAGERVPAARTAGTLRPSAPGVLAAGPPVPSCASPAPVPAAASRALELGVWAGRTAQHSRPTSARKDETSESRRHMAKEQRKRGRI